MEYKVEKKKAPGREEVEAGAFISQKEMLSRIKHRKLLVLSGIRKASEEG